MLGEKDYYSRNAYLAGRLLKFLSNPKQLLGRYKSLSDSTYIPLYFDLG